MKLFGYDITIKRSEDKHKVVTNIKERDTFKRIQNLIIRNCDNYEHEVTLDATSDSLCLDSLDEVELIMFIEEEFDIEIKDSELEKCDTV